MSKKQNGLVLPLEHLCVAQVLADCTEVEFENIMRQAFRSVGKMKMISEKKSLSWRIAEEVEALLEKEHRKEHLEFLREQNPYPHVFQIDSWSQYMYDQYAQNIRDAHVMRLFIDCRGIKLTCEYDTVKHIFRFVEDHAACCKISTLLPELKVCEDLCKLLWERLNGSLCQKRRKVGE